MYNYYDKINLIFRIIITAADYFDDFATNKLFFKKSNQMSVTNIDVITKTGILTYERTK